ncbi:MAG: anaerobic ribonucleoside-triphosphate reductase activating protein [Oscillospiraceae bacterium]|nr:anaerobic ribonucleoside-triphosphate reductase activating protein [Oscillospiraceae bacterium]
MSLQPNTLRVSALKHDSSVDGPGLRYVIFLQGCPHRCPGCHNPGTLDVDGGFLVSSEEILCDLSRNPLISGITLSGGEPLEQAEPLTGLVKTVKSKGLSVWLYSGYTWEEIMVSDSKWALLSLCDVLVDGRFDKTRKSPHLPFRGSENQRIIDVPASISAGRAVPSSYQLTDN